MPDTEIPDNTFYVVKFVCGMEETVFTLDHPKQDCDKIVFRYGQAENLKEILFDLFKSGKSFDFHIRSKLEGGRCEVESIEVSYFDTVSDKTDRRNLDGPYDTYLSGVKVVGFRHYFRTNDPKLVDGYVWFTAPSDSPRCNLAMQAFTSGNRLNAMVGFPHTNFTGDSKKAGTIIRAEIVWACRTDT